MMNQRLELRNEGQTYYWGTKDMHFIRSKGNGAGIMISDFVDEYNGLFETDR